MKKFLSLVLALVMTMSLVTISAGAKDFTDDSKITYKEAVDVVSAVKIVGGYEDGSFNPTATLTRGAAAKIICNMILGPTTAGALKADAAPYKDVPADSTFAGYIAFCAKEGIISGYADGTFKPGNSLTGYAFMKMLLGALGYDKAIEGYEGANWSINVAKRALAIGLDDDLVDDFDGTKPVTREEACLFAFNTLKADLVKYDNQSSIQVGDITITSSSKAEPVDVLASDKKNNIESGDNLVQFAERYFTKLSVQDAVDAYGRPAVTWMNSKTEIGTYGNDADAVYTKDTKLYTVRTDLGVTSNSDSKAFYYTINSASVIESASPAPGKTVAIPGNGLNYYTSTNTTKLSDVDVIGTYVGNGVTVEIFYDKDDYKDNKIIVIDEFIDEIDDVDTDDDGRYVSITAGNFHTKEFEEGDMVLYTMGNDGIASMALAEKVTGTLTKINGSKYTIGGTTYEVHKGYNNTPSMSGFGVGDEVEFYLDSNGYIIKADLTSASAAVDNLVLLTAKTPSGWDTIAKAVYATGKTETVTLKDAGTAINHVYSFTTSSGKLKVSDNSDYTTNYYFGGSSSAYYFTKGATAIKYGAGAGTKSPVLNVDAKTTFVYIDVNGDAKAYTGYKNAPDVGGVGAKAMAFYMKKTSSVASVVYIWTEGSSVSSNDKNLTYMIADSYDLISEKNANGDIITYYEVRTLSGDTVRVDDDSTVTYYKDMGVVVYKNMTKDDDGIVDISTSSIKDTDIVADTLGGSNVKESNGVLYFAGGAGVSYTDDVVVYVVDADGDDFGTIKVTSINDNNGKYKGYTYVTNTDGEITTLVLKKA